MRIYREISPIEAADPGASIDGAINKKDNITRLTANELALMQKLHPDDATKWKGAPLTEASGIKVNSGIVVVEIDGKRHRMNTAASEFGRLLPD
jgi:hypothetical protein